MKGLWLEKGELAYRENLPRPEVIPGWSLVRVLVAGVCSTDLGLCSGLYPFTGIIGHEFVGIVEAGFEPLLLQRVVGDINIPCHVCVCCQRGVFKHCLNRRVLGIRNHHGAFAEYLLLPNENLHLVPESIATERAVFTEPLAAAMDVLEKVAIQPNDKVLVIGDGRMGQLIARVISTQTGGLMVLGKHADKCRRLPGPIQHVLTADACEDASFDIVVECTGNEKGLHIALDKVKPQGHIVLKSTYPGKLQLDSSRLVVDEVKIVGSRCGDFEKALDLMETRHMMLDDLIDGRFPLSAGIEALEASQSGIKVLIECPA